MPKIFGAVISIIICILIYLIGILWWDYASFIYNSLLAILIGGLVIWYISKFGPKKYTKNMKKNKPSENFEMIYQELYKKHGNEFKRLHIINWICLLSGIIMWIFAIVAARRNFFEQDWLPALYFMTFLMCSVLAKNKNRAGQIYKVEILPEFINSFPKGTTKYTTQRVYEAEEVYRTSGFNLESYAKVEVMDCIKHSSEDVNVEMASVWVSDKEQERKDLIFSGLFAYAESVKHINYFLKISKNSIVKNKYQIDSDSRKFEEIFDVQAKNEVYAMRILTSDVMMLLLDFYEKYELKFEVILSGSKIYLRFYTGQLFDVKLFGNSINKNNLFMYYSIMEFIIELTKSINKELEKIEL